MIYVIGESRTGIVKIGSAGNPHARLREIQAGNPAPLHLLATFPGGRRDEIALHRTFVEQCVGGEWFDLGDDVVTAVAGALADESLPERRPAVRYSTPGRARAAPVNMESAENTLRCVLGAFADAGNPSTLTTASLLAALRTGPEAERWRDMVTTRAATMALASDLRACAGDRSTTVLRGSVKVPAHDGTGRFVNGYHRRDVERLVRSESVDMSSAQ